jgi:glycosyltransferase involved in cell wall biosynthesis
MTVLPAKDGNHMPPIRENSRTQLSVVVPIFNEESILLQMAEELAPHLDEIAGVARWQFVLVDNGSTDGSRSICDKIVSRWPASIKIELSKPDYGEALYQGLIQAEGTWAFVINVDFWDVSFIRWCFRTRGTYDMVMGSKRADDVLNRQSSYRRWLSWGLNTILQTVFNFPGTDTHGQKFIYLPALRPVFAQCVMRRGQFDTEFTLRAARARLWLAEVPVPIVELRRQRNLMLHKIARNIVDIWRLRMIMRKNRSRTAMRYHRWSREDVEQLESVQTELIVEMGRLHRGEKTAVAIALADSERSRADISRSARGG